MKEELDNLGVLKSEIVDELKAFCMCRVKKEGASGIFIRFI